MNALPAKKILFLGTHHSLGTNPKSTDIVTCSLNHVTFPGGTIAMVEPNQKFEKKTDLCVTSAIVKLDKENKVINVIPQKVTVT